MGASREVRTRRPAGVALEFDAFSVAVGLAVISGALSVAAPYLTPLTVVLDALAVAGWAAGRSHDRDGLIRGLGSFRGTGILIAAAGATAFVLLTGPLSAARGLALALSFVPLWLWERGHSTGPRVRPGGAA